MVQLLTLSPPESKKFPKTFFKPKYKLQSPGLVPVDYESGVLLLLQNIVKINLKIKYKISTPLMIENPVSSPIVPPMAESLSTNFADVSLVILSNVGVSK